MDPVWAFGEWSMLGAFTCHLQILFVRSQPAVLGQWKRLKHIGGHPKYLHERGPLFNTRQKQSCSTFRQEPFMFPRFIVYSAYGNSAWILKLLGEYKSWRQFLKKGIFCGLVSRSLTRKTTKWRQKNTMLINSYIINCIYWQYIYIYSFTMLYIFWYIYKWSPNKFMSNVFCWYKIVRIGSSHGRLTEERLEPELCVLIASQLSTACLVWQDWFQSTFQTADWRKARLAWKSWKRVNRISSNRTMPRSRKCGNASKCFRIGSSQRQRLNEERPGCWKSLGIWLFHQWAFTTGWVLVSVREW